MTPPENPVMGGVVGGTYHYYACSGRQKLGRKTPSTHAWTHYAGKTKRSHADSPQRRPQRPTRRRSTPSPTSSDR
jgi:hypothetical protein